MRPQPVAHGSALPAGFAERVVAWQATHGRNQLPWQGTRDPYRVWLSEVMLQQTQVATVRGYYDRFLQRFPDVQALAEASADAVMGLWSGLGYYSRARNLHACARAVVAHHGGMFPRTAAALATLPGIGRSTAAAIASFCFGERVAILDANVQRVLGRVLAFDGDLASAPQREALWSLATALLPTQDLPTAMPRYTQGLMDIGATLCTPRRPQCLLCPVQPLCAGARSGDPERYPVKTRSLRRTQARWWLLWVQNAAGQTWLERRPPRGIWAGLHSLPVFESEAALADAAAAAGIAPHCLQPALAARPHALTHKDLLLHPVPACAESVLGRDGAWFGPAEWGAAGLPAPVRSWLAERELLLKQ